MAMAMVVAMAMVTEEDGVGDGKSEPKLPL